jgi:hypothetical protein
LRRREELSRFALLGLWASNVGQGRKTARLIPSNSIARHDVRAILTRVSGLWSGVFAY